MDVNPARFLVDSRYRHEVAIPRLRAALDRAWSGLATEVRESFRALGLVLVAAEGRALTLEEKGQIKRQLQDVVKAIPMLGVFLLPGGMILLPVLLKVLPFDLRLSGFREPVDAPLLDTETVASPAPPSVDDSGRHSDAAPENPE